MTAETRRQVEAEVCRVMAEAKTAGRDLFAVVRATFPGIPDDVLYGCYVDVQSAETEAWWQVVERTIDGEVIRNAVAKAVT